MSHLDPARCMRTVLSVSRARALLMRETTTDPIVAERLRVGVEACRADARTYIREALLAGRAKAKR